MSGKNKRWVEERGGHSLYFVPFYDEIEVAHIWQDEDGYWLFSSSETKDDSEWLEVDTLEEAKNEADLRVNRHYSDEIDYYTTLLDRFQETTPERQEAIGNGR